MSTPGPSGPTGPSGSAALQAQRVLVGSLVTAPVVVVAALAFVLGGEEGALDVTPLAALPLALAALAHLACTGLGYRMRPVAPGTAQPQAEQHARQAFASATLLRFAICEAVLLVSIAAAFVVGDGGLLVAVVGGVLTVVLVAVHCWPSAAVLRRSRASLERDGARSHLHEAYGLPPERGGAVQEQ